MKIAIVEDEFLSKEWLLGLLKELIPDIEVVGCFDSVRTTVDAFNKGLEVDLLFLDIHLADGLAFDIFSQIQVKHPIIFTTAYNEYAIQAFKVNSIDYLLKPLMLEDVKRALEKFKLQKEIFNPIWLENISKAYKQMGKTYKTRFMVRAGQHIDSIPINDIHHFTTLEGVAFLVKPDGKRYAIDYSLDDLEELLPPQTFFRINRKTIVHIQIIQKVNTHVNSRLQITTPLLNTEQSIVSRERVQAFKQWLDQ